MLSPAFQIQHCACVKTEVGRRLVVNSACYKFLALHNDFVELDKMQVNIQGVECDLQRIEQIDSRLYNNNYKDTQRVIQELKEVSTRTNNNTFANFVS